MDSDRSALRTQQEARETGQRLIRTIRWLVVAAVVTMAVASCVLVLYLLSL
jgi:hypothetical protein